MISLEKIKYTGKMPAPPPPPPSTLLAQYFHLLFIFLIFLPSPLPPNLLPLEKRGDFINGKGIVLT